VSALVRDKLPSRAVHGRGAVLDGYPRTVHQWSDLELLVGRGAVDRVLYLDVPASVAVERLESRQVCGACGQIARGRAVPAARRCAGCGRELSRRADDKRRTITIRQQVFQTETLPLLASLEQLGMLSTIEGSGAEADIARHVAAALRLAEVQVPDRHIAELR
jgi:adenylate kinase family enzyme